MNTPERTATAYKLGDSVETHGRLLAFDEIAGMIGQLVIADRSTESRAWYIVVRVEQISVSPDGEKILLYRDREKRKDCCLVRRHSFPEHGGRSKFYALDGAPAGLSVVGASGDDALTGRTLEQVEAEIAASVEAGNNLRDGYMKMFAAAATPIIIRIGQNLKEEKALCRAAGIKFGDRIKERFGFSQRTADNYMAIADQVPASSPLSQLPYTKVVALLAVPKNEREQFAADVGAADMSKAELQEAIRQRNAAEASADDARKRADAADAAKRKVEAQFEDATRQIVKLTNEAASLQQAADRAGKIADKYMGMYQEAEEARKAEQNRPPRIIREAPKDYEALQREVERLRKRAEDAEAYAQEQETARKKAQQEANALKMQAADAEAESAGDPLSPETFAAACRDFMAVLGHVPNMEAYFRVMSPDIIEQYRPWLDSMCAWADGARKALALDCRDIDTRHVYPADGQIV